MTSTQRYSRHSALLLLLSVSALRATGGPCSSAGGENLEISGEELPDTPKISPSIKWRQLTSVLIHEVTSLRDQQFVEDFGQHDNMTNYKDHRLELPLLVERECLASHFNKESCLLCIFKGLQLHAHYLKFVERHYLKSSEISGIISRSKVLGEYVMEIIRKSKRAQEFSSDARDQHFSDLPVASAWEKKITIHVLLREYRTFLTQAFRALCHIEQRTKNRTGAKLLNVDNNNTPQGGAIL